MRKNQEALSPGYTPERRGKEGEDPREKLDRD